MLKPVSRLKYPNGIVSTLCGRSRLKYLIGYHKFFRVWLVCSDFMAGQLLVEFARAVLISAALLFYVVLKVGLGY